MITKKTQLKVYLCIMAHASKGCQKCHKILEDIGCNVDDNCLREMKLID